MIRTDAAGLVLTKDLILQTMAAIFSHPDYRTSMGTIHDFSRIARIDLTHEDLDDIVTADVRDDPHTGRVALVMGDNIANRIFAQLYEAKATHRIRLHPKVVRTMPEAETWVFGNRETAA